MPMLLRPLEQRSHLPTRLTDLGRSRKTAVVAAGLFQFVAVVGAGVTLACFLDAAFHMPAAVRAIFLVLLLVGGGALFLRRVRAPLAEPVRALHVAHLLEARYPKLNDSLASAIEFLLGEQSEHTSARFRRVAVVRAQRALDRCRLNDLVPSGRAWQMFLAAAVVVAVATGLTVTNPVHARHAAVRLADPFGAHPWPTKTEIVVTLPEKFPVRAAVGDPFDLAFTLTGVIPDSATVQVQFDNGNAYEEPVAVETQDTKQTRADVTVRLEAHRVPRSFRFRIHANDATTAWHEVSLAPPPKLIPLDGRQSPLLHATFPSYTDLSATDLPDGTGVVDAVHGTRLKLRAATDRRVVSAVLVPQVDRTALRQAATTAMVAGTNPLASVGAQQLADDILEDIPVAVEGSDGRRMSAEFTPKLSGLYALKFTDETGISGTRLFDFRIQPDPAPMVVLERPAVGRDPVYLLPTASVFILARAEDRTFAVRQMMIEYRVGGPDAPLRELLLVDLPAFGTPLSGVAGSAVGFTQLKQPSVSAVVSLPVSLFRKADGSPPVDGDRITLRAAATDYDDVSVLKEPGRSKEEFTVVVVSKQALDTFLLPEMAKMRDQLLKVREQQRQVREKTDEVAKAAAEGKLKAEDAARLSQAERDQRGVRNDVTDPRDGLQQAAQLLKDTVETNKVPRTATTERVEAVADGLARLAEQNLDPVEPLIAAAKQEVDKGAEGGKTDPKKVADDLKKAVRQQQAAEANLDSLLKQLEQWGGAGEVRAEARAMKEQLNKAGEQGQKAAEQVEKGKPADALTPAEKAELDRAADKFNQLADRAGATLGKAERLAAEKEAKAAELKTQADAKAAEAAGVKEEAGKQTPGSDAAKDAQLKADKLGEQAAAMKADADKAKAEADALNKAVQQSGGQDLVNDLRNAGAEMQKNSPAQSAAAQKSAAERLDKLAGSLAEKQPELGDQLKKKKDLADQVFELEKQQDELRKKVKQAEKLEDPKKREEELKNLAREQERLREKTEQTAEKLTREREPEAAEKLRAAADKMDAAKSELEQGKVPEEEQKDALDRLKDSVEQLDQQRDQEQDKLTREKRTQMAEQLKALRGRLKAADDEAARIQADVVKRAGWDRAKLASLSDLEERTKAVAEELRKFAEKELEPLPVFRQLTEQAAKLSDDSAKRFAERKADSLDSAGQPFDVKTEEAADERTRRPLRTALRRIDHVLDSLKEDPKDQQKPGGNGGGEGGGGGGGGGEPGADANTGVPTTAQLKALRGIQAELNDRTAAFAKAHPDTDKLSEADREELEELEGSQREVAELFEKLKSAFAKPMGPGIP